MVQEPSNLDTVRTGMLTPPPDVSMDEDDNDDEDDEDNETEDELHLEMDESEIVSKNKVAFSLK